jgi:hypothetical protein
VWLTRDNARRSSRARFALSSVAVVLVAARALAEAPSDDAAGTDARSEDIAPSPPPRVSSSALALSDNQPFELATADISASTWLSPRVELAAGTELSALRGTSDLSGSLGRAGGRVRFGSAAFDARANIAGRYWSDSRSLLLGDASGELFPDSALRLSAGAFRREELSTPAAALLHVVRDSAFLNLALHERHGFNGVGRAEATRYSDGNLAFLAFAWATYALVTDPLRVDLGYAAAYRDTAESRWDAARNAYFPYTTPLKALRQGPVASAALLLAPVQLGASVSVALVASENDPTTIEWYESRRDTEYVEARGFVRVSGNAAALETSYDYLRDGYYVSHTAKLSSHVSF